MPICIDTIDWPAWIQAVGSVVAILIAVGVAAWQWHQSQTLQAISVRPILSFERPYNQPDGVVTISIHNQGLGPAILRKVEVLLDDETVPGANLRAVWIAVRNSLKVNGTGLHLCDSEMGIAIPAGEKLKLFSMTGMRAEPSNVLAEIARIGLRVEYESIAGERFVV